MVKVFIDMDGVIVDFDLYMQEHKLTPEQTKLKIGAYRAMKPIAGALSAVREIIALGYDVYIATKPPTDNTYAYTEKADWIFEYLPELKKKIIITHNKGLLGDKDDILIDDRPHKGHCVDFKGEFIHFGNDINWDWIVKRLKK